jgi:hypothetical protein
LPLLVSSWLRVSYFLCFKVLVPQQAVRSLTIVFLRTNTKDVNRGTPGAHYPLKFGNSPKWGETSEELRDSMNFDTPADEDAYGNKLNPVENLTPVFHNSYDKLYAAVDKVTGEFKECKDMHECNETVHWSFKLAGTKMEPMVFEGKSSLIDFTNKIKETKAVSVPGVSYDLRFTCSRFICSSVFSLNVSLLTYRVISHYYYRHRPSCRRRSTATQRPIQALP